jgi:hypothetical protein
MQIIENVQTISVALQILCSLILKNINVKVKVGIKLRRNDRKEEGMCAIYTAVE